MTVSSDTTRTVLTAPASEDTYAIGFSALSESHVSVTVITDGVSVSRTLNTHYTIDGDITGTGANVVFEADYIPEEGATVLIVRSTPVTQETDYLDNDAFPAAAHEAALDKLTMIAQERQTDVARAVTLPDSSALESLEIPDLAGNAGKFLMVSDDETGFEYVTADSIDIVTVDLVLDTTPQLGGDLDCNGKDILVNSGTTTIKDNSTTKDLIAFTAAPSAVNYLTIANAATGNAVTLSAAGTDTNIGMTLTPKGSGALTFSSDVTASGAVTFNGAIVANSTFSVKTSAGTGGAGVRLYEDPNNGTNYLTIKGADSQTANNTIAFPDVSISSWFLQQVRATATATNSTTNIVPNDGTIPQISEGKEYMTCSITPKSTTSTLIVEFEAPIVATTTGDLSAIFSLYQDTTANAVAVTMVPKFTSNEDVLGGARIKYIMTSGTTSAITFSVRYGPDDTGTAYINRRSGTAGLLGNVGMSSLVITELI